MIRASLALALLAAPALAADKAPAVDPRLRAEFAATDTDGNGMLSRAEIRARVAHMNTSRAGLTATQATTLADRMFAGADADRSGGISPVELQAAFRAVAQRYDTNHDGVASAAERQAAHRSLTAPTKGR